MTCSWYYSRDFRLLWLRWSLPHYLVFSSVYYEYDFICFIKLSSLRALSVVTLLLYSHDHIWTLESWYTWTSHQTNATNNNANSCLLNKISFVLLQGQDCWNCSRLYNLNLDLERFSGVSVIRQSRDHYFFTSTILPLGSMARRTIWVKGAMRMSLTLALRYN